MKTKSSQALLSVGGAWREWACPALLIQMRSSMRPAFNGGPGRHTTDSTMTAPSNTYDVIVVGGGISGRSNSSKLYFAVQGSQTNCTSAADRSIASLLCRTAALCVRWSDNCCTQATRVLLLLSRSGTAAVI